MQHSDLLESAAYLVARSNKRKPRQADLKRAQSTIYYAIFHSLARSCADLMIGGKNADRSKHAWRQVYRALEHGSAKDRCKDQRIISRFPIPIGNFASLFVEMQSKRHLADYDPFHTVTLLAVKADLVAASGAIKAFLAVPTKDRRAFTAWVLLRPPRQ